MLNIQPDIKFFKINERMVEKEIVIARHPKFPNIIFKEASTKEELLICLKAYAETSVIDNEFIKQMNISAE